MAFKAILLSLLAAVCLNSAEAKHWALLVAGSNTWAYYSHQADICHAYHILRRHGIPAENIVTMMYNDIAYNDANPFQGNIINRPHGPNVYSGVTIDYEKNDVNPEVFLAVLRGDKGAVKNLTGQAGKVIDSGPDDLVFVNFADHGGPGVLCFPNGNLKAKDLSEAITEMHTKKKYRKLVFYVDASYSGSMFNTLLPNDINVYAMTAANPYESSYVCYWDNKRNVYLGDVFSINWMQDSDKEDLKTETIHTQFEFVKKETNTSHVQQYGTLSISKMAVGDFQGNQQSFDVPSSSYEPITDAVPAQDAELHALIHQLNATSSPGHRRQLAEKLDEKLIHRFYVDKLFRRIVESVELSRKGDVANVIGADGQLSYTNLRDERQTITQWDCYESAFDTLEINCPKIKIAQDYYALQRLYVLINLCERGFSTSQVSSAVLSATLFCREFCGKV